MPDTRRTLSALQALLADNTAGDISAQDMRDVLVSAGGVLLAEQVASTSATLDFTSFLSSTYDDYEIRGTNLVPATTGSAFYLRMGSGGGPTYDAGSNYFSGFASFTGVQLADAVVNTAVYGSVSFVVRLVNPQSASVGKFVHGTSVWHNGSVATGGAVFFLWNDATALTAVRALFSTGNIASGTIRIYGI